VYAGKDPLTGREIRFRKTRRTEVEAQIELGRLLELARFGRNPDSGVTVAKLLDAYVPVAGWEVSTEEANLGYIRRTIKPALGIKEVRKARGPLLRAVACALLPDATMRRHEAVNVTSLANDRQSRSASYPRDPRQHPARQE
jgi:hypothetical protein